MTDFVFVNARELGVILSTLLDLCCAPKLAANATCVHAIVPVTVCVPTACFSPLSRSHALGSSPPSSPRHRRSRTLRKATLACSGSAAPHRAAAASRVWRRSAGAFAPAHGHYLRSATCGPAAAVAAMVQETVAHELRVCKNTSRTPVDKPSLFD